MLRFAVALVVVLSAAVLVVPSPAASAAPTCHGREATIVGTNGNDRIRGTGKRDVIVARDGNDRIWGLGGNDVICGNAGQDRLWGGGGDDRLEGGIGDFGEYNETWGGDYLMPGGGDDVLILNPKAGRRPMTRISSSCAMSGAVSIWTSPPERSPATATTGSSTVRRSCG